MRRIWNVLFWSVIAAAFIGPGTVTTAGAAGAAHGLRLIWALAFSTLACVLLQEAAGRLSVVSGRDLGQALRERYRGTHAVVVVALVLGAVVLGCAAYEAGNILGGVAGAAMATDLPRESLTVASVLVAGTLLWLGTHRVVARCLGLLVAVMGVAFLWTAWRLLPDVAPVLRATAIPGLPDGSEMLALGLVGTTVVPYNLFLGSGLAHGHRLGDMRFGLIVSIGSGGLISMGIVVVGCAIRGEFEFGALADVLGERLGPWGGGLFAIGLGAAGLSSAITAPLAAALTAQGLLDDGHGRWAAHSWRFRSVWVGVLAVGLAFGLTEVKPIPAILMAQALNGILLPFVAVFLLIAVNDYTLMGARAINGVAGNVALATVVAVSLLLGTAAVVRATAGALALPPPGARVSWALASIVALGLAWPVGRRLARARRCPE